MTDFAPDKKGTTTFDYIDLSAFDLEAADLTKMISSRGTGANKRVIIDLRSVGGGIIELADKDLDD